MNDYLINLGEKAKSASRVLEICTESEKSEAILKIAAELELCKNEILEANKIDVDNLVAKGRNLNMKDRLLLSEKRIKDMADGACQVARLADPVGEILEKYDRPNGMVITKVRVPLGVIGIIYESRPNVTVDAAVLCLKAGNAVILRGGSEAINSNKALVGIISNALLKAGLPKDSVQLITDTDREIAREFMKLNKYVDVLIPRGGAGLISTVVENSTIPVIETGTGVCHAYVDADADFDKADRIVINAKTQRPSVCNAIETLLIDSKAADKYVPLIIPKLKEKNVEVRACGEVLKILGRAGLKNIASAASESDWSTEYNDMIISVKSVDGVEGAIEHINKYGTRHSECIITENRETAGIFQKKTDAACVYVNVSTRFTDGFEFGLGAEIGISNQKLHARGPMGIKELTTIKYLINGNGQIRE